MYKGSEGGSYFQRLKRLASFEGFGFSHCRLEVTTAIRSIVSDEGPTAEEHVLLLSDLLLCLSDLALQFTTDAINAWSSD